MKPTKQTVCLIVKVEDGLPTETGFYKTEQGDLFFQFGNNRWMDIDVGGKIASPKNWVKSQEGYFFTQEELNEYTQSVIKQALEAAAEKAKIEDIGGVGRDGEYHEHNIVDKQSITNTFEETFKIFSI